MGTRNAVIPEFPTSYRKPSFVARCVSGFVRVYLRHSPIERGKWWLRRVTSSWLVARLQTGPWIRVSGVSEFEWASLRGIDSNESNTVARFLPLLAPGQIVLDVGANIGFYALTAAARVGRSGKVIAFEPNPASAARIRENARLNGLTNIRTVEAAVSDRCASLRLRMAEDSAGCSLYDVEPQVTGSVEVPATTLDHFASTEGLDRVDLLKIDAEGAEVKVLRGARGILSRSGAPPILIEANPVTLRAAGESVESLRSELESFGYTIEVIEAMTWKNELVANWLATKKSLPEEAPDVPESKPRSQECNVSASAN